MSSNCLTDQHKAFIEMCEQELDRGDLPIDFSRWTLKKQYDYLISNISKYFPNIPKSLRFVLPATFEDGDCSRPANEKPDWLDMDKFHRGQQFALRNFVNVSVGSLISLLQIFSFEDGLKPLIISNKSNTPNLAFTRYLSTIKRFRNWFTSDPWRQGTHAYNDIQRVRDLHRAMRKKLLRMSDNEIDRKSVISDMKCPMFQTIAKDFADACPAAKHWQCPYTISRMKGLNQGDMLGTQFASMGLIVLYPAQLGIHDANDEDLEAFCHLWRGLGYLLGMKDRYNFCNGDLQEIRQRAEDLIEHWIKPSFRTVTPEWEHMCMCVYKGAGKLGHMDSYKVFLLYLCDMLNLNMPGLRNSLSFHERIKYTLAKFIFLYLMKLRGVSFILNSLFHKRLNKAINSRTAKTFHV